VHLFCVVSDTDKKSSVDQAFRDVLLHLVVSIVTLAAEAIKPVKQICMKQLTSFVIWLNSFLFSSALNLPVKCWKNFY